MPEIFTLPRVQVFDSSGNPMAGAKLYAYAAGTTTPQNTYSDSGLSIANANPVVADSSGVFGAIFLSPSDYKFVLQTSAGVTVWTADNVSGGPSGTFSLSDNGATIGPSLILDRASASPAANDVLGGILFKGRDSGGGTDTYAQIQAEITDPAATSEDGILSWLTAVAGTLAARMKLGAGLMVGSPTGGDKGAGTLNMDSSIYMDGKLAAVRELIQEQTASAVASLDFPSIFDTTYDQYEIEIDNLKPATDDVVLRVSPANGTNYTAHVVTYANRYQEANAADFDSDSSTDAGGPSFNYFVMAHVVATHGVGNNTGECFNGSFKFRNPELITSSTNIAIQTEAAYVTAGGVLCSMKGGAMLQFGGNAFNGFRVAFSSGNINSGSVRVYGVRKQ